MARVTVVDCLENVDNRFQLVLVAAKRVRQLMLGAEPLVEPGQDKHTVIALREIADGHIGPAILEEPEEETIADYFDDDGDIEIEDDSEIGREIADLMNASATAAGANVGGFAAVDEMIGDAQNAAAAGTGDGESGDTVNSDSATAADESESGENDDDEPAASPPSFERGD